MLRLLTMLADKLFLLRPDFLVSSWLSQTACLHHGIPDMPCGQAQHSRVWLCDRGATKCRSAPGRKLTLAVWRSLISALSVQ